MTVGEKIQFYRKQLGLSQDDLGQKLFVSRQTVSLWEKNQTAPTISNLIRLAEIFGISVDELLGLDAAATPDETAVKETYRFSYTQDELQKLKRLQVGRVYKMYAFTLVFAGLLIAFLLLTAKHPVLLGVVIGLNVFLLIVLVIFTCIYGKLWKGIADRLVLSTYEFKVFEKEIEVSTYREDEKTGESRYTFADIEKIRQLDRWLYLQLGGDVFILRRDELKESSAFFSYMYQNPSKIVEKQIPKKWGVTSAVLSVASLLSLFGAVALSAWVAKSNGSFVKSLWVFFLMLPFPLASLIFGLKHKSDGSVFLRNIILGILVSAILCIFGLYFVLLR